MKILFLFLFTLNAHSIEVNDKLAGKVSVDISEGPPIFETKITMEKIADTGFTDPMERLSAFATCYEYQLIPKLLDGDHQFKNGSGYVKRNFKCVPGDLVDWIRASRMMCSPSAGVTDPGVFEYCKKLAPKLGKAFTPCDGKCETVMDSMIFRQ